MGGVIGSSIRGPFFASSGKSSDNSNSSVEGIYALDFGRYNSSLEL